MKGGNRENVRTFIQALAVGLRLGSIYALVALGYTMVYGIIRLINFAHGDFLMVGGYTMIFTVPLMLLNRPSGLAVRHHGHYCLRRRRHGYRGGRIPPDPQKGYRNDSADHGHRHQPVHLKI